MAVIPPSPLINRILSALGLENVRSLKISAEVNSAVAVVTEQYVTRYQMDNLATALEEKEWLLVPKGANGSWLTDAEREAIEVCAKAASNCGGFGNGPAIYKGDQIAATLRGLLERTREVAR